MSGDAQPPDPGLIQNFSGAIGLGVAALVGGIYQWFKGTRDKREERRRLVIEDADIADTRPMREALEIIKGMERTLEGIREDVRLIEGRMQSLEVEVKVLGRSSGRR